MNEMIFNKKRFVIVGSGDGIGKRTAQRLLEKGARVMINDFDCDKLKEAEIELKNYGDVHACLADTRSLADAETLAHSALFKFGGVDVWMNISGGATVFSTFVESDPSFWKADVEGNLISVFNGCKAILPHFYQRKAGRIVNTVYETGRSRQEGFTTYSAAKAGVIEFTKSLSGEVGKHNIFVNTVSLGRTVTENHQMIEAIHGHEELRELKSQCALRRLGDLDDAANALMFMASDQASWITGQTLVSNGGF